MPSAGVRRQAPVNARCGWGGVVIEVTDAGAIPRLVERGVGAAYQDSRARHAEAVRNLVLDGLAPDEVNQLTRLTYAVLTRLDPQARYGITTDGIGCPADPRPANGTASEDQSCPADPADHLAAPVRGAGPA